VDTSPPTGELQSALGRRDVYKCQLPLRQQLKFFGTSECYRAFTRVLEEALQSARGVNTLKRNSFAQVRSNEFSTAKSARQQGRFPHEQLPDDD